MKISISGASGFIGKEIMRRFADEGWTFNVIDRGSFSLPDTEFSLRKIEGSDVVINLAGAPIVKRWTEDYKKEIYASRILTTRKIAQAITRLEAKPKLFISASAIGIYDPSGTHSESSTALATDFIGQVCRDWEEEARRADGFTRLVVLRTGLVLGTGGGTLKTMYTPFSMGLGAAIGNGSQPFSWIHLEDLFNVYKFIIAAENITGIVNAVAPEPTTNLHFTKIFGKVLNQPAVLRIPEFALKLMYGEGAGAVTSGQSVLPDKLLGSGFIFKFPTIEKALVDLYRI
jgi:uncharacterized protein